jgi:phosphatidylserine/phosphatidylglycerophosphate/cardiolipin synthase-like enzyme
MKKNNYIALEPLKSAGCEVKYHNPKQYTHLHNKGIIIDDEIVIITSTNFTDTSIMENRECGLVIKNKTVANYFLRIFDTDWHLGLDKPDAKPTEIITESDPRVKTGKYSRISLADIIEI